MNLEDRLRIAEIEVCRLKALMAAREEPYPVGTVLLAHGYDGSPIFALRLGSVHKNVAQSQRPRSDKPVWITVWPDFSGRAFASLSELKEGFPDRDWKELYVPRKGER